MSEKRSSAPAYKERTRALRTLRGMAAACIFLAPTSCGADEPELPALDCEIITTTVIDGSVSGFVRVIIDGSPTFASIAKDVTVSYNTISEGATKTDEDHVELYEPFDNQFPNMDGVQNRIEVEVTPADPAAFNPGHCSRVFPLTGSNVSQGTTY